MDIRDVRWSESEKQIARIAYELARQRDYHAIRQRITEIIRRAGNQKDDEFVCRLNDYLRKACRELDEKYDFRYSVLIYVFARLIREGLLSEEDLIGLREEKLEMIRGLLSL
jgi:predicted house-cleaning noncanonical NTP pyrophosphatase (MazG superfamily)